MDSLTQMALGAAVGGAVLGRRVGSRALLWGAVIGTLPDLDVLISHADPVRDFTFHRAETHAFFYQSLAAPVLAWPLHRMHLDRDTSYSAWLLLVWLCLVTHACLDAFTIYGTQLLLPFSDYPVGLGSVFIIDPLYTLPLIVGIVGALVLRRQATLARRWNITALALSTVYLGWSAAAQSHVEGVVHRALAATSAHHGRVLVTPTPFNTLLWRVVVMDHGAFHEGFVSVFDRQALALTRYPSRVELLEGLRDDWAMQRLAWFSKGFYAVDLIAGAEAAAPSAHPRIGPLGLALAAKDPLPGDAPGIAMADLRMGQVPWFVFTFVVGRHESTGPQPVEPRQLTVERPAAGALAWVWWRIWDETAEPPPRPLPVADRAAALP